MLVYPLEASTRVRICEEAASALRLSSTPLITRTTRAAHEYGLNRALRPLTFFPDCFFPTAIPTIIMASSDPGRLHLLRPQKMVPDLEQ